MSQDSFQQDSRQRDAVDEIVTRWAAERPDLDTEAKQVTGRVIRLAALFQQAFSRSYADVGLDSADYGILAALRRSGPDYALAPTELARRRMMTSGGITAAVDRLDRRGLVDRVPNPADRRGNLVRLTDAGRVAIDEAVDRQAQVEQRVLRSLEAEEVDQLVGLLRRVLLDVEGDGG